MSSFAFLGPQNGSKSLAAGALLGPHWGSLQRSPDPLDEFKGPTFKTCASKEGKERRGGGAKMIYVLGRRKHSRCHRISTLFFVSLVGGLA